MTDRSRTILTGLCFLFLWIGFPTVASAMPTVDLFFTGLNGAPIADATNLAVLPGDQIGVEMRMTGDDRGVYAYSLTVDFDGAGGGQLLVDAYATLLAPGFVDILGPGPQGPGDPLGAPGQVRLFAATAEVAQPNPFSVNSTFTIAQLEFTVTDAILAAPAVIAPGLFNVGVDEVLSNEFELIGGETVFNDISADFVFNSASLRIVPEPGTALLLAGGLFVLAGVRRRR